MKVEAAVLADGGDAAPLNAAAVEGTLATIVAAVDGMVELPPLVTLIFCSEDSELIEPCCPNGVPSR